MTLKKIITHTAFLLAVLGVSTGCEKLNDIPTPKEPIQNSYIDTSVSNYDCSGSLERKIVIFDTAKSNGKYDVNYLRDTIRSYEEWGPDRYIDITKQTLKEILNSNNQSYTVPNNPNDSIIHYFAIKTTCNCIEVK